MLRLHCCAPSIALLPHTARPLCTRSRPRRHVRQLAASCSGAATDAAAKYGWDLKAKPDFSNDKRIKEIPVAAIRRPLQGVRGNDQEKVEALMQSITDHGLHEPIDVLEVEGQYYGFSGCHRFEAHQRLGLETILCRVRKATREVLKMHMM